MIKLEEMQQELTMIDPKIWVADVLTILKEAFGLRLAYLGLQGSYRRGEATEDSDIDLVVLLDVLETADLDLYRSIVHAMPEGHKACGFICGVRDFAAWPRHELFPFKMDTADFYGQLDDFLPPVNADDIRLGVNISASALVHMLTHSYLYAESESRSSILKEACKSAFFIMRVSNYLATGVYSDTKKDLFSRLDGVEKQIVAAGMDFPLWQSTHSEQETFTMLLEWSRKVMCNR